MIGSHASRARPIQIANFARGEHFLRSLVRRDRHLAMQRGRTQQQRADGGAADRRNEFAAVARARCPHDDRLGGRGRFGQTDVYHIAFVQRGIAFEQEAAFRQVEQPGVDGRTRCGDIGFHRQRQAASMRGPRLEGVRQFVLDHHITPSEMTYQWPVKESLSISRV
jgi:hypothetical protein